MQKGKTAGRVIAIGLMSGTSADGVDAALLETDGEGWVRPLEFMSRPYTADETALIRRAARHALSLAAPVADARITAAEAMLTRAHAEAIRMLPGEAQASIIGFHGQTVAHRPPGSGHLHPFTWQIGDARLLARLTGRPVVHDFRSADVAAGGQGAPLAPGYHRARLAGFATPVAILNLGGVGNLTWFANPADPHADWGGFDTGPANALIDDWVRTHTGAGCDENGALAASGVVHEDRVQAMAKADYLHKDGSKSLDRDDFSASAMAGLSVADGAASLSAFTAETIAIALARLPARPRQLFVTGGGRLNPVLMAMIAARSHCPTQPVEALGWNGDALEAEAFAWLAVRHLRGLPLSWPQTTGVPEPLCGGRLVQR